MKCPSKECAATGCDCMIEDHHSFDTPVVCPECGSGSHLAEWPSTPRDKPRYDFECGAWANVSAWNEHGAGSVVYTDSVCEYRNEIKRLKDLVIEWESSCMCGCDACILLFGKVVTL